MTATNIVPPTQTLNDAIFWTDPEGRLVPDGLVKPLDKTRDQLVRGIVVKALGLQNLLREFKAGAFADIAAFVELSSEQYGVQYRGEKPGGKGNLTLYSFDGRYKIMRKCAEHLRFDERLQVAKQLIDECLTEWCDGARDEIKALVNDAFQVDKTGRINTTRVLSLRRLEIEDDRWKSAMQAIGDATIPVGTSTYLMVYERIGDADEWRCIAVDLAAV